MRKIATVPILKMRKQNKCISSCIQHCWILLCCTDKDQYKDLMPPLKNKIYTLIKEIQTILWRLWGMKKNSTVVTMTGKTGKEHLPSLRPEGRQWEWVKIQVKGYKRKGRKLKEHKYKITLVFHSEAAVKFLEKDR